MGDPQEASFWISRDPEIEGGFRIIQAEPTSAPRHHYKLPSRETAEHFLVARGTDAIDITNALDEVGVEGRAWLTVRAAKTD